LLKEREAFRRHLLDLIIKKEEEDLPADAIPSAKERQKLRYYYYIHNGIDTVHVAPIDKLWLQHIYALIPKNLLK